MSTHKGIAQGFAEEEAIYQKNNNNATILCWSNWPPLVVIESLSSIEISCLSYPLDFHCGVILSCVRA